MFDKSKLAVAALFVAAAELLTNGAARADAVTALQQEEQYHEKKMSVPEKNKLWVCASVALKDYNTENRAFGRHAFVYNAMKNPSSDKDGLNVSVVFDPGTINRSGASIVQTHGFNTGPNIVEGWVPDSDAVIRGAPAEGGKLLGVPAGLRGARNVQEIEGTAMRFTQFAQNRCRALIAE